MQLFPPSSEDEDLVSVLDLDNAAVGFQSLRTGDHRTPTRVRPTTLIISLNDVNAAAVPLPASDWTGKRKRFPIKSEGDGGACPPAQPANARTVGLRQGGRSEVWWSLTESNRRHPACKAGALPAELRPRRRSPLMVGRDGLEPSTSRLSGVCSNHLSYRPIEPANLLMTLN